MRAPIVRRLWVLAAFVVWPGCGGTRAAGDGTADRAYDGGRDDRPGDRGPDLPGDAPDARPADAPSDADARFTGALTFVYGLEAGAVPSTRRMPMPSDLFRDPGSGLLALPDLPSGTASDPGPLLAALHTLEGFSVTAAISFPFTGAVEPVLLPPASGARLDAPYGLARLEAAGGGGAPGLTVLPTVVTIRQLEDDSAGLRARLAIAPERGVVLAPDADYVGWVTRGVLGIDGRPSHPDPAFAALRDAVLAGPAGPGRPADPLLGRAYDQLAPALAALQAAGIDPHQVVALTRFHTQPIGRTVEAALGVVAAAPAPVFNIDRIYQGSDLDTLLGVPAEHRPGVDQEGMAEPAGPASRTAAHDAILAVVLGHYDGLDFLEDMPGVTGRFVVDAQGTPIPKATRPVPWVLILPKAPLGGSYARLAAVVWHHGLNNARSSAFGVADALCHAGLAVIAHDAVFHGSRRANPVDAVNNITGAMMPDGLGDTDALSGVLGLFDFAGTPTLPRLDPRAIRDGLRQTVIDVDQTARLLAEGDPTPVRDALGLGELSFASDRIAYFGESLGGVVGSLAAATTRRIGAFVLSVPGGGILLEIIPNSSQFSSLAGGFIGPIAGLGDDDLGAGPFGTEPSLALFQGILDDGDPLAYAARVAEHRPHILMTQAQMDETIPHQATQALARAMGLAELAGSMPPPALAFVQLPKAMPPVMGNLSGQTGALVAFTPASHGMTINQHGQQTLEPDGPPFVELPMPVPVDNPIIPLQAATASFLSDYAQGRIPAIPDPVLAPTPFSP